MQAASRLLVSRLPRHSTALTRHLSTSRGVRRPPAATNPGVTAAQFRALFDTSPASTARGRARPRHFRWDWHLRNFLMALIPPAVLLLFLRVATYQFGGDHAIYDKIFDPAPGSPAAHTPAPASSQEGLAHAALQGRHIEERLAHLERQLGGLQSRAPPATDHSILIEGNADAGPAADVRADRVARARDLARAMSRDSPS
ncbi:unnamed protein product [Chondrus crispus]|uniref:Uncharacterized protein n=1 Tax=Chondrus crispus TaxID=2769 RepID=R7QRZ5_CHOCR|nr:unnamed protein product [Chondrus crispus]CDF40150.1 unnamed protein product [Chondrus crispus]|eukprot:XP_005710444.1 unnamed protein product [Chondrus crispus]